MAGRSLFRIVAADGTLGNRIGYRTTREHNYEQRKGNKSRYGKRKETRRGKTKGGQRSHPAQNNSQATDVVQPEPALAIKHFKPVIEREQQGRVIRVVKRDRQRAVVI